MNKPIKQSDDMERPTGEAEVIKLADLEKEYYRLQFLVDTGDSHIKKEVEVSLKAGELVGVLYDALLKQYKDPSDPETLKSLNALCVRLVFCLYAEDAGIFGSHGMFHNYLEHHQGKDARRALIDLFKVLDTKPKDRDPYMDDDLAAFPYVNGGLFADESIIVPRLDDIIVDLILNRASGEFDWSAISPTIFGAVFESTLNPETRRSGGMHYTSMENIHKVIDPLFLDGLREELAAIKEITVDRTRDSKLRVFQSKLAGLTFLDPACGSGNFLTETYISLRRLENEALSLLQRDQITMGNPPFVGAQYMFKIQKTDIMNVFVDNKKAGVLDFVAGWYHKAAEMMQSATIHTAFVSTNSITQGEQVAALRKPLYEKFGIHIDFAIVHSVGIAKPT